MPQLSGLRPTQAVPSGHPAQTMQAARSPRNDTLKRS
jgi:hypothetical protein